jgi:methylenetetrahydrofolate reductase (NADPH)
MSTQPQAAGHSTVTAQTTILSAISGLARDASIELNVHDVGHLGASQALLAPGTRIYVSFLPNQSWQQSIDTSRAVRAHGFEPVPHLPARLVPNQATLRGTLDALVADADVREVLLIAGDYDTALGPFASVADVLRTGVVEASGIRRVSIAGHPEGHPRVPLELVRQAALEKVGWLARAGLEARFVTQFFFEPAPFIEWSRHLRARGVHTTVVPGLAGPARLSTLFKFALRCGAGPSIRALGARPSSFIKLLGDHGPENVVRALAQARIDGLADFSGFHLFCFGGFVRSCEWLHAIAAGCLRLTDDAFVQT